MIGMNSDKIDVSLVPISLGHKASQKAYYLAIVFDGKTRWAKVDKKNPGQQMGYLSAAPPVVDDSDNRIIVHLLKMPDVHMRY